MSDKTQNSEISIDERLLVLLEISENQKVTAQIQDEKFNSLVETFAGLRNEIANNENLRADTFSERSKQSILKIENIAQKVATENVITKEQLVRVISETVTIYFAQNLATELSNEVKQQIHQSIGESVGDIVAKALQGELEDLRGEIRSIKGDLRAVANDTKDISKTINEQLQAGANEIVENGINQILVGVESATQSYQSTVANLEKVATLSTKKAQPIFEGLESVGDLLRGKLLWFTGLFCLGSFLLSMLTAFIVYQIKVPSPDEITSRLDRISQLDTSIRFMQQQLVNPNYELKDNKLYVPVDRNDCHDSFGKNFCLKK